MPPIPPEVQPGYFTSRLVPQSVHLQIDRDAVELVERSTSTNDEERAYADALIGYLTDALRSFGPFQQLSTQGRAVYSTNDQFTLTLKGIGRSPASHETLRSWDMRWRSILPPDGSGNKPDAAGEMRIDDATIPWLVAWRWHEARRVMHIAGADVEGFDGFMVNCVDFAMTSQILQHIPGVTCQPMAALLRYKHKEPWSNLSGIDSASAYIGHAVEQYLRSLHPDEPDFAVEVDPWDVRKDLDGVLLSRHVRSPYRLHDIHMAAIDDEWANVDDMLARWGGAAWGEQLLKTLAQTAGALLQNGILHGLLYANHQNVSAAGEIADHDAAVVTPFTPLDLQQSYWQKLREFDERYSIKSVPAVERLQRLVAPSREVAACGLVEQAYYLNDKSLFMLEIVERARTGDIDKRGPVLTADARREYQGLFVDVMREGLDAGGRRIASLGVSQQRNPFAQYRTYELLGPFEPEKGYKNIIGYASPLGWEDPRRTFNHHRHVFTEADTTFLEQRIADFGAQILGIARHPETPGPQRSL